MKCRKIIPTCVLLCLLQGCVPNPPEVVFDPPIPESFQEQNELTTVVSAEVDLFSWWKQFQDPLLNELIEEALNLNFDAQLAYEKIHEVRANYHIQSWQLAPKGNLSGLALRTKRSDRLLKIENPLSKSNLKIPTTDVPVSQIPFGEFPFELNDFVPPYQNFFFTGFDAYWELDFFGQLRAGKKAAYQALKSAIENARDVQISVIAEVARQYIQIIGIQERIGIISKFISSQKELLSLSNGLLDAGLVSKNEEISTKIAVESAMASLPPLESARKQSIYQLAFLLGRKPENLFDKLADKNQLFSANDKVPIGIPSELLRRRPDVRKAERDLQSAHTNIWVAKTDLFPKFYLTGLLGQASRNTHSLFKHGSNVWALGPFFTWPIINLGSILSNIDAKTSQAKQALIAYEKAVINSLRDVETSLIGYGTENERYLIVKEQLLSEKTLRDLSLDLFQSGLVDFSTVLQRESSLLSQEDNFIQSKEQLLINLIGLYKALGGGWEVKSKLVGAESHQRAYIPKKED